MNYLRNICLVCVLFFTTSLCAQEFTEKLNAKTGDIVTITYNVIVGGGDVSVSFGRIKKQLGLENNKRYDDPSKVKVLFFDRNGGFQGDVFNSKISTEALTINSDELRYTPSQEGYVWLDNQSEVRFTLNVQETKLSIPIYLAYYKKKHTYDIIAYCGTLNITLSKPHHSSPNSGSGPKVKSTRTTTKQEEVEVEVEEEVGMSPTEVVECLISRINASLNECSGKKLPEGLEDDIRILREKQLEINDKNVLKDIDNVLQRFNEKKDKLEELRNEAEDEDRYSAFEEEARHDLEYVNERLEKIDDLSENDVAELKGIANQLRRDSHKVNNPALAEEMNKAADKCDEEMKKIEDSKKKKNVWMIIGGILLAILMFVGNQAFQHFRNLRNQRGIAEMQENMVKRAENDARRRARNAVQSRINRAQSKVINKSRDSVRNGVKNSINNVTKGKGNKSFTI